MKCRQTELRPAVDAPHFAPLIVTQTNENPFSRRSVSDKDGKVERSDPHQVVGVVQLHTRLNKLFGNLRVAPVDRHHHRCETCEVWFVKVGSQLDQPMDDLAKT